MAITLSLEMKLCFPGLVLGLILFLTSFGAPYWLYSLANAPYTLNYGLWKQCVQGSCFGVVDAPAWLLGVDVLECIALALLLGAILLTIILAIRQHFIISLLASLAALGSGVLGAVGAAVLCAEGAITGVYVDWAFVLNIIADVIVGLAGVGMLVNTVHMRLLSYLASQANGIQNPLQM